MNFADLRDRIPDFSYEHKRAIFIIFGAQAKRVRWRGVANILSQIAW